METSKCSRGSKFDIRAIQLIGSLMWEFLEESQTQQVPFLGGELVMKWTILKRSII
ncbi:hypothetical protein BVRB_6g132300 [Beta vulgaris subsp. vulgaris]|nr:hypothetical protein BVRB_6g132300 [Beta vulgaris subsp. vulgaris]